MYLVATPPPRICRDHGLLCPPSLWDALDTSLAVWQCSLSSVERPRSCPVCGRAGYSMCALCSWHCRSRTPSSDQSTSARGPLPSTSAARLPSRGHTRCADTTNRDSRIAPPGTATSSIRFAQCREYMNLLSVANTRKRGHGHVQCEVVQGTASPETPPSDQSTRAGGPPS